MGRVQGKVALITGAARGQGRAHALRLAEEGADIIAVDLAGQIGAVPYELAGPADLALTTKLVEEIGGRIVRAEADVRDQAALDAAVQTGVEQFGPIGIVVANAGVGQAGIRLRHLSEEPWRTTIDVNVTGVWHTVKAAAPSMIEAGAGGSIIITSSSTAIKARTNVGAYVASKHALTGLMRTMALELAPHRIRVNTVNPTSVPTPMLLTDRMFRLFRPDLDQPQIDDVVDGFRSLNALPVPWVETSDISNAVLWLASDEARCVTGAVLPVDAGSVLL
ncbi:3-ketoacyl-ACP reductase [Frankia sp. R43]|uniref:mycofactocin-coupled SDR family oxidoreductase n=1 Tax=Frankia sp. R43 TaxID=269536 RepID=UPI0006CA0751|nr:mycofactocin-coupled SDR family oxidoreductase [Frankia sp. R43]KPM51954.1 3-ketoacyl-ACP reductase [Frankia sp. R43]